MSMKFNPFTGTFDYVGSGGTNTTTAGTVKKATVTPAADGSTTVFTVPDTYVTNTLLVFVNGVVESQITETSGTTFTFATPPLTGDDIHVFYATSTGGGSIAYHYLLESGAGAYLTESGNTLTLE